MADTCQDHHDWSPGGLSLSTLELHQCGFGSVGGTAAAVCAETTEARLVGLHAGAVLISQMNGFVPPHRPLAPRTPLLVKKTQLCNYYAV